MTRLRKNMPGAVFLGMMLVLAVLLTVSAACKKKAEPELEAAPTAPPVETWVIYAPEGESFEILTPVAFTCNAQKVPTDAGEIDHVSCLAQPSEQRMYILVRGDMPEALIAGQDAKSLIQGARDGLVKQYTGIVEQETPITLGEYPGLQVAINGTYQGANFYLRARFYLVKNRLYQLYIVVQRGFEGAADFDKYFDSFKLK